MTPAERELAQQLDAHPEFGVSLDYKGIVHTLPVDSGTFVPDLGHPATHGVLLADIRRMRSIFSDCPSCCIFAAGVYENGGKYKGWAVFLGLGCDRKWTTGETEGEVLALAWLAAKEKRWDDAKKEKLCDHDWSTEIEAVTRCSKCPEVLMED